jgi:hypothetical protein
VAEVLLLPYPEAAPLHAAAPANHAAPREQHARQVVIPAKMEHVPHAEGRTQFVVMAENR